MLGSPTIWEHTGKTSLRNFKTERGIKILDHFFIKCFVKDDVTKYIIKVNLFIILWVIILCY